MFIYIVFYAIDCLNSNNFMVLNMKNQSQCRFQLELQLDFLLKQLSSVEQAKGKMISLK